MNQGDFLLKLIEQSKTEGFTFLLSGEPINDPKRVSAFAQAFAAVAAGAVWGLLGSLSTGYLDQSTREKLTGDLRWMNELCDLAAIHLSSGHTVLRLVIDADNVSQETIVGRCALIHERTHRFREYGLTLMRSVFSDGKLGTHAQVILVFSSHEKAKDFGDNYADKCEHTAFWKKVHTKPWVVDLEDEEMQTIKYGIGHFLNRQADRLRAGVFR